MLKSILYIVFLLISFASYAQGGCFHAIQDGQEVEVICANKPVFFRTCTPTEPTTTVIYELKHDNQTITLDFEESIVLKSVGAYTVIQYYNEKDKQTESFEKSYTVRVADTVPEFRVTACASNIVSVTVTDDTYDAYTIDFGDGNSTTAQSGSEASHTYTGPGTYAITVTGSFKGSLCYSISTKPITTLPGHTKPTVRNLTVKQQNQSGEIQLEIQGLQKEYLYIVERLQNQTASFQQIDTLRNISQSNLSHTLQSINSAEGAQYRIRVADECNSITSGGSSNPISSIVLSASSGNEQANLNWQSMPWAVQYEVFRNNTRIATLNSNTNQYTDTGLSCGQNYTYFIKGTGPDGNTSVSAAQQVQVTSTNIPAAPYLLASFNLNNEVELSINLPQDKIAQKVDILKSINGRTYQQLASVQQLQFTDGSAEPENVCYQVSFTDPCNNTSKISNTACPIVLNANKLDNGAVQLKWNKYTGFPDGMGQYTIELLDENGNVINAYPATGTTYTDRALGEQQLLRYRIKATSVAGTEISYSNLELIEQDLQLHIPSAFTPNGDGLNDVLEIKGRFIKSYTLKVYSSLGNVVYEGTDGAVNWDGNFQGKQLPAGAYAYEITVKTNFGATKRRTGTVMLLR